MKKAVFLFFVLSLVLTAGCGALMDIESVSSQSGQPTVAPTPLAMPSVTIKPTLAPTPVITPVPEPFATLPPGIREEARFQADLDGDWHDETILVYSVESDSDFGDYNLFLCVLNSTTHEEIFVGEGFYQSANLVLTPSDVLCVLISCGDPVDGRSGVTYACSFNGLIPIVHGWTIGIVNQIDTSNLTLIDWADFIGSWYYTRNYKMTNDFSLVPVSDMIIDTEDREPLVAIRKVPVEMGTDGAYTADTLPAGTSVWPVSADGEGHMTFRLKDGRTGRITYTQDNDYGYALIDGVNVDEYFDNIEYWG